MALNKGWNIDVTNPICYGREVRQTDGSFVEEGDLWEQAKLYWEVSQQFFAAATKSFSNIKSLA